MVTKMNIGMQIKNMVNAIVISMQFTITLWRK